MVADVVIEPYWCTYDEMLAHLDALIHPQHKCPCTPASYQLQCVEWLMPRQRGLIRHDMRMRKTQTAILYGIKTQRRKWLIQCSKNAMSVWKEELLLFVPGMKEEDIVLIHVKPGKKAKAEREKLWKGPGKIFICTYQSVRSDKPRPGQYDYMICDEIHKSGARNYTTAGWECLAEYFNMIRQAVMTSGTPVSKVPQFFSLFKLLDPGQFKSYWQFIGRFCKLEENGFGKEIVGVKNVDELKVICSRYIHTAYRKDYWPELPPKTRGALLVDMTRPQREVYRMLIQDLIAELPGGQILIAPNQIAALQKLRLLLCSPTAVTPELGYGAAVLKVREQMDEEDCEKTVIFTPFAKAIPEIQKFFTEQGFPVRILKGGVAPEVVAETKNWFNSSSKGIVICSIQFAQAFSLASTSVGYFIGMEWNPDDNMQAEDRLWSPGNPNPHFWYVLHRNTIEDRVIDVNDIKVRDLKWMSMTRQQLIELAGTV